MWNNFWKIYSIKKIKICKLIKKRRQLLMTAKVFENGKNQIVQLPSECRLNTDEVAVNRIGDVVMLVPKTNKWNSFTQAIDMFSEDFMEDGRAEQ
jgi:antitoxin VapB